MNERMRELSVQAEKYADDNFRGEPTWSEAFESKFGELIVHECINEVEGLQVSDWNQNWNQAIAHTALHLKEHFGVEE